MPRPPDQRRCLPELLLKYGEEQLLRSNYRDAERLFDLGTTALHGGNGSFERELLGAQLYTSLSFTQAVLALQRKDGRWFDNSYVNVSNYGNFVHDRVLWRDASLMTAPDCLYDRYRLQGARQESMLARLATAAMADLELYGTKNRVTPGIDSRNGYYRADKIYADLPTPVAMAVNAISAVRDAQLFGHTKVARQWIGRVADSMTAAEQADRNCITLLSEALELDSILTMSRKQLLQQAIAHP